MPRPLEWTIGALEHDEGRQSRKILEAQNALDHCP